MVFVTLELTRNILLENLSSVNHCDFAAPIRSLRSWANGFFTNRGSTCQRSLSLLPQLSLGQFAENRFEALLFLGTLATQASGLSDQAAIKSLT